MMTHPALRDLDESHELAAAAAKRRIDEAEEHLAYYRSQVRGMHRAFYDHAACRGISDDPAFRTDFQRAVDEAEENVREAGRRIDGLHEELQSMTSQHLEERERLLERHRQD